MIFSGANSYRFMEGHSIKKTSKLLALVLSLVMVLSLGAVALGEGEETPAAVTGAPLDDYTGKTVILHSNDVHGELEGYAYIAYLKQDYEAKGAEVILVDAGDFSQGTTYVSSSKGASAITMMNAAGYDIVTLGNHEFDYGYAQLMSNLESAEFVTICANVILDETGESILPAGCVYTTNSGLKLGFFGMETPETATKVNPGLITEISFTTFDDLYTTGQAAIDEVKNQGADLVIGITHLGVDEESAANGYRSIDFFAKVTGADLLLDGHSHTVMTEAENGEPIQSTGTKFAYVGVIVIDNETKSIEDHYLLSTETMGQDTDVLAVAQGIEADVDALYGQVFAVSNVNLNGEKAPGNRTEETNMGDLITDAMIWKVAKEGGTEQ
ncbi:MAG: bifunctional metallophosphatase/5'-nucleotidase, partial [Clostridia bacterium]|nr:bifunctional metallophosphatase/5'-nucleotidase [Clostridia bacterium]